MDSSNSALPSPVLRFSPPALSVFVLLLIAVALISAGWLAQVWSLPFGIWFTEVGIFLGISWWAVSLSGRNPLRYPGAASGSIKTALFGLALGAANFFAVVIPIQFLAQRIAPTWMKEFFDASRIFKGQGPIALAIIVAGVGIAAPFCEEYFFRGVFLRGLGKKSWALWLSAVIFSALHVDPVGFAARTELGLLFGLLFLRTGSLWPGIMAHAANNLISTALFFGASDTGAGEASPSAVALVSVAGGIFLIILLVISRRLSLPLPPPLKEYPTDYGNPH